MAPQRVIDRVSTLNGHDDFSRWASEIDGPTGIRPEELNEHITGKVLCTLEFLNGFDAVEDFNPEETKGFILGEIEYFKTHKQIRTV